MKENCVSGDGTIVIEQARQLTAFIQGLAYCTGMQTLDSECCENISHGEYRAMKSLCCKDFCTMQDLAQSTSVTKSGATRIVGRLESKGLAQRQKNKEDGRICCVVLTPEGRSFLRRIEDQISGNIQTILAAMDPAMREILLISLGAFLHTAQRQEAERQKVALINK